MEFWFLIGLVAAIGAYFVAKSKHREPAGWVIATLILWPAIIVLLLMKDLPAEG